METPDLWISAASAVIYVQLMLMWLRLRSDEHVRVAGPPQPHELSLGKVRLVHAAEGLCSNTS